MSAAPEAPRAVLPVFAASGALQEWARKFDRALSKVNTAAHLIAAFWLFAVAMLISMDVLSRALFNAPFSGTAEIVANSVVSMVFLQIPSALRSGGLLRAEILDPFVSVRFRNAVGVFACILGAVLFTAIAVSAWAPMVEAWSIGEFAGNESTVQIPLYPIRTLLVSMSVIASLNFLVMAIVGPSIP